MGLVDIVHWNVFQRFFPYTTAYTIYVVYSAVLYKNVRKIEV